METSPYVTYDQNGHLLSRSPNLIFTWQNDNLVQLTKTDTFAPGNIVIENNAFGKVGQIGSMPAMIDPLNTPNNLPVSSSNLFFDYPYCGVRSKDLPTKVTFSGWENYYIDYVYEFDANMYVSKLTRTYYGKNKSPRTDEFTYACQ